MPDFQMKYNCFYLMKESKSSIPHKFYHGDMPYLDFETVYI